MEGLLCCWALAMEEYSFDIVYCKGSLNGNANALSHLPATTSTTVAMTSATQKVTDIQQSQQHDIFQQLFQALSQSLDKPVNLTRKQPLLNSMCNSGISLLYLLSKSSFTQCYCTSHSTFSSTASSSSDA